MRRAACRVVQQSCKVQSRYARSVLCVLLLCESCIDAKAAILAASDSICHLFPAIPNLQKWTRLLVNSMSQAVVTVFLIGNDQQDCYSGLWLLLSLYSGPFYCAVLGLDKALDSALARTCRWWWPLMTHDPWLRTPVAHSLWKQSP